MSGDFVTLDMMSCDANEFVRLVNEATGYHEGKIKEFQQERFELLDWAEELRHDNFALRQWYDNELRLRDEEIRALRDQLSQQGKEIEF